jgi:hypothetical protein
MRGCGGTAPPFLTSAVDGGEWPDLRPGRFIPGDTARGTHKEDGWVPKPVCTPWSREKSRALAGGRTSS